MATYRFEAKIIGRSHGRSATASAAYRSAEKLEDERTGASFDYTRKRGVLHSEIIAPEGTPEWMHDRAQLWNAVEKVEKRKDAQLAREVVLSLPHELTHAQRVELVQEFVRSEFVDQGMVADVSIHAPDREGDQRNHHAHVMLTMRELTGEGFGPKVRAWNSTERLEQWREDWGQAVNRDLERHGHEARVDHRSLADQGIDREPEPKQGPIATEMERAGRPSHAGDDRRAAQARNEERAAIEAELPALTAQLIDLEQERERRREHESEPAPPRHLGPDEPFAEPSPLRVAPDQEPAPPARDYVESPPLTGGDSIVCLGFDMFSEFIHEGISLAQAVGDEVGFVVREIGRSGPQSLEDFATAEILRRSAEPPPREITPAEYATSTEARRAYHDQQAAERAAAAARSEALDQLRDEIKGSRSLDPAAIRNLSTDDLVNIKSKGDDGLRAIIEDHERDQKRQREDVGRERER